MKDLKKRTVHAAGWIVASKLLSQVISFGVGIVLARLLLPNDFGLIAMAAFFIGIAGFMVDIGFGQALIQKQDVTAVHFSSIFWINFTLSIAMGLGIYFSAESIALFYDRQELRLILEVLSVNFFLGSFGFIPRMILTKNLEFKKISIAELSSMILSGITAITAAYNGYGYWSLVIHGVGQQLIKAFLLWLSTRWMPMLLVDTQAVRELFSFSIYIFWTRLLQYLAGNIDKLLLGKYIGSHSVGIYDKAQSMMITPLAVISDSIGSIMFPSLSLIQNDKQRIRNIYIRTTRSIALVTFPMMTGMFAVSESFVYGVLGNQWSEIIPVIKIFCIAGIFSSLATVVPAVYQSLGKAALQMKVNLITQPLRILATVIGLNWGMYGVVAGFTAANILTKLFTMAIAGRLIDLKLFGLLVSLIPVLAPSLLMAAVIMSVGVLFAGADHLHVFIAQVLLGILSYCVFLVALDSEAYRDTRSVIKEAIFNKAPS